MVLPLCCSTYSLGAATDGAPVSRSAPPGGPDRIRGVVVGDQHDVAPTTGEQERALLAPDRLVDGREPEPDEGRRRRLRHDIKHELATISLLASLLCTADDVGAPSRVRATQLLREAQWLEELLLAFDDAHQGAATRPPAPLDERLQVDVLVGEVVAALCLTHSTRVHFRRTEAWTCGNRLALWRALRNVLDNAVRAAGPQGRVRARVAVEDPWAVVQIDDDGPGLGSGPTGLGSLGLGIVRDILVEHGGSLAMATSDLGGGRVRLLVPAVPAPDPADVAREEQPCGY
jgi:signal transduction histidine kinase